jgi:hypothetical protein
VKRPDAARTLEGQALTRVDLEPRDVTAALRRVYPRSVSIRSDASPDGPVLVSLGHPAGRYLGIGRDHAVAANLIGWHLGRPVTITSHDYPADCGYCVFVLAPADGPRPVHPGGWDAVPTYDSADQVLGGQFPANRLMKGLISLALDAGCRPHLAPWRSGHGRQYRVGLWHTDPQLLHGCIDVSEVTGRFAAAYLQWGRGDERRLTDRREVRQNLASCRDRDRAGTAAAAGDVHRLAKAEFPASVPPRSSVQTPRGGSTPRRRAVDTVGPAPRPGPRSLR